jgi:energy-converting hydrogenase A subunit M
MEEKRSKNTGEDEESEDSENIIINEVDGLPNLHPNFEKLDLNCLKDHNHEDTTSRSLDDLIHDEDLPMSVIVTNVDPRIFKSNDLKVSVCFLIFSKCDL